MPLQCIIVDDYQPFLKVARAKLEQQGIAVVGVATNGTEALRQGGFFPRPRRNMPLDLSGAR